MSEVLLVPHPLLRQKAKALKKAYPEHHQNTPSLGNRDLSLSQLSTLCTNQTHNPYYR